MWIKGSSSWAAHVGRLVRRRPFPWPPFVERPWLSSPPVWHTPPSAAHAAGAVQARPTLLSVLQHWVAGLMHRPPHLTLPEGQAAREKGGRCATRCRHEHVASLPLPMFAYAKLRDAAHCKCCCSAPLNMSWTFYHPPQAAPSELQVSGEAHCRPAVGLVLQHWVCGLMHLLPHLVPTLLSLRQHWVAESMHLLPQVTWPEGQAAGKEEG